jgi:hypothetical protein
VDPLNRLSGFLEKRFSSLANRYLDLLQAQVEQKTRFPYPVGSKVLIGLAGATTGAYIGEVQKIGGGYVALCPVVHALPARLTFTTQSGGDLLRDGLVGKMHDPYWLPSEIQIPLSQILDVVPWGHEIPENPDS